MKKSILFILFMLCTTLVMQAQPERGKFNPEEFRAKLEEFITKKTDLSNTEAQAFFPIFHKMKEEQRTLQTEIFYHLLWYSPITSQCKVTHSNGAYFKLYK